MPRPTASLYSLLDQLSSAEALTRTEHAQSIVVLAQSMGLPESVVERYVDNRPPSPVRPVDNAVIQTQQATADLFYQNKLLPKALDVGQVAQ